MNTVEEYNENRKAGWVSIYRSVREHWIWDNPVKFQWWVDILLEVNHKDHELPVGYEVIVCKRGQTVRSLKGWANRWNVSRDTVRHFFNMLRRHDMIALTPYTKTTLLTVCNYETYQDEEHSSYTIRTRKPTGNRQETDTNNNDNNENKKPLVVFLEKNEGEVNPSLKTKKEKNSAGRKNYLEIAKSFYAEQIEEAKGKDHYEDYKNLATYFLEGPEGVGPFDHVLKIKAQLQYQQFIRLIEANKKRGLAITVLKNKFKDFCNNKSYTKDKETIYLTILSWINKD